MHSDPNRETNPQNNNKPTDVIYSKLTDEREREREGGGGGRQTGMGWWVVGGGGGGEMNGWKGERGRGGHVGIVSGRENEKINCRDCPQIGILGKGLVFLFALINQPC